MSKDNSTRPHVQGKPDRPEGSPLFWHASGRWAKKIRGSLVYFGRGSHDDALALYLEQRDQLHSGKTPADTQGSLTVFVLAGKFLTFKKMLLEGGELTARTFGEYVAACKRIIKAFGRSRLVVDLRPEDFQRLRAKWVKRWGPVTIGGEVQRTRTIFKYACDEGLIDRPIRFGPAFKKPSKKTLRLTRAAKGKMLFTREEIQAMLAKAGPQLRAMILLGINCGLGNGDCGKLPLSAVDLQAAWLDFPRPKTGIRRRCPLWPETVEAIKATLAKRPDPKDDADAGLVFITKYGGPWAKSNIDNPLSKEIRKLLDSIGINGHRNFYCLRRGFETVAGESKDQVAVDFIMGHSREDMASVYRQDVSDERLQVVVEHVRAWLFGDVKTEKPRLHIA